MKNVLIWGNSSRYEKHVNLIMFEQYKGNINILAYISKDKCYKKVQDGKPVILPDDIIQYNYDYIIIANSFFKEIKNSINVLGITEDVLIPIDVFLIPLFDFNKYINIKERKISIIAESCYGGYLYHSLRLKFTSPFINMRIFSGDYFKLLNNLEHYLSMPFEIENDNYLAYTNNTEGERGYLPIMGGEPVAKLGDVRLRLLHANSFSTGKELWDRRVVRFNNNDVFVFMVIENDNMAEQFEQLPFKNKIGFYFKHTPYKSIVNIREWNDPQIRCDNAYHFRTYIHRMFTLENYTNQNLNIFDLFDNKITERKSDCVKKSLDFL